MALNFRIASKAFSKDGTALQLFGDFDGSSAWQLINALDENMRTAKKIAIHTDGLRAIHAFGLDVFRPRMSKLEKSQANIQVTGRFRDLLRGT
jgi:hypothetical protein